MSGKKKGDGTPTKSEEEQLLESSDAESRLAGVPVIKRNRIQSFGSKDKILDSKPTKVIAKSKHRTAAPTAVSSALRTSLPKTSTVISKTIKTKAATATSASPPKQTTTLARITNKPKGAVLTAPNKISYPNISSAAVPKNTVKDKNNTTNAAQTSAQINKIITISAETSAAYFPKKHKGATTNRPIVLPPTNLQQRLIFYKNEDSVFQSEPRALGKTNPRHNIPKKALPRFEESDQSPMPNKKSRRTGKYQSTAPIEISLTNQNPGPSVHHSGLMPANHGLFVPHSGQPPANSGLSAQYSGFRPINAGLTAQHSRQMPANQGFSVPHSGQTPAISGQMATHSGFMPANTCYNQGFFQNPFLQGPMQGGPAQGNFPQHMGAFPPFAPYPFAPYGTLQQPYGQQWPQPQMGDFSFNQQWAQTPPIQPDHARSEKQNPDRRNPNFKEKTGGRPKPPYTSQKDQSSGPFSQRKHPNRKSEHGANKDNRSQTASLSRHPQSKLKGPINKTRTSTAANQLSALVKETCLAVGFVRSSNEPIKTSVECLKKILNGKVIEEMLKGGTPPRFQSILHIGSCCVVTCADSLTRNWLDEQQDFLSENDFNEADIPSTQEVVQLPKPKLLTLKVFVPDCDSEAELVMQMLQFQNPGIVTSNWTIRGRVPVKKGLRCTFGVPEESMKEIENRGLILHCGMGTATCTNLHKPTKGVVPLNQAIEMEIDDSQHPNKELQTIANVFKPEEDQISSDGSTNSLRGMTPNPTEVLASNMTSLGLSATTDNEGLEDIDADQSL